MCSRVSLNLIGVSPKSFDGPNAFANEGANVVSMDDYTSFYHAQFVIDAYAKLKAGASGSLSQKMNRKSSPALAKHITPSKVKAAVMYTLETLLNDQFDEFTSFCEAYVTEYNKERFVKRFADRAKIQRNNGELDEAFYQRVQFAGEAFKYEVSKDAAGARFDPGQQVKRPLGEDGASVRKSNSASSTRQSHISRNCLAGLHLFLSPQ